MELALLAQRAENRTGVPCGIMDQAASALGRRGTPCFSTAGHSSTASVSMPAGIAIAVIDSGVRRRLEETGYAERRREVERGLAVVSAEAARRRRGGGVASGAGGRPG